MSKRLGTRRWRWRWLGLGVAIAVGGGATVTWALGRGGADGASETTTAPGRTAEIVRQSIADIRTFGGTLGHGEPHTVLATGDGVVTDVAPPGAAVERGSELYRVDEHPVVALIGDLPMYRDIERGDSGRDVAQLIENLRGLGYGEDCEATDEVSSCIRTAIRQWQEDLGVEVTGIVARGDLVFVPAGGRVDLVHAEVGRPLTPGEPVVDLVGSDQIAALEIETRHRDLLPVGAEVVVEVPGGSSVAGEVTAASVVAAGEGNGTAETVTTVEVTLAIAVDEAFLGAPVDIVVEVDERVDVLTVPVTALLAVSASGHAVEVVDGAGVTSLVPVDTGLFAMGWVEVSGDGIDEGTVVVVAGR